MPTLRPLRPGDPERIADYPLLGVLGEGGQGTVYLGRADSGQKVAIKILHPRTVDDPEALRRFVREIQVARQVDEFATAAVLQADLAGDRPYIVSQYVDGPTLEERVKIDGPLDEPALRRLAMATADALAAIHRAGIVHRDFKPGNVILGPDGPQVIDFGIARALDGDASLTSGTIGTPAFMSPEQIEGDPPAPATDIFSWALTMAFAATGKVTFGQGGFATIMNRIVNEEPSLAGVPESARDLLEACLAKRPDRRPTATEVIHALATGELPADKVPAPPPIPPAGRPVDDVEPRPSGMRRPMPRISHVPRARPSNAGLLMLIPIALAILIPFGIFFGVQQATLYDQDEVRSAAESAANELSSMEIDGLGVNYEDVYDAFDEAGELNHVEYESNGDGDWTVTNNDGEYPVCLKINDESDLNLGEEDPWDVTVSTEVTDGAC